MSDERGRDPEQLLKSIQKEELNSGRGELRVFFGMCPGVGKTYAMLKAAHVAKSKNLKVLVGVVETHGRSETMELVSGLEVLPAKKTEYKGSFVEEMDLDEVLKIKPNIVLVDELAHTNAPNSRHPKRYQDVEEILAAGIDVYTTMNVQHLESRADLVYQITGAQIRETVPDSVLQMANAIEVIDITPENLIKRLKEGKVYLGDRAEKAAQNFFKVENITALRELALRFTAEKVDDQLKDHMAIKQIKGPWNTNERLLVAVSHSPYSARLVRITRRMAFNLEAPWIALYVDQDSILSTEDKEALQKNLSLAKELGAEVVTTRDNHIGHAIRRIAEERNVTQIVMGRPDRRLFRDFFSRGTLLDQLVQETSEVDVHVVRQERKPKYIGFQWEWFTLQTGFIPYWLTLWFLIGLACISSVVVPWIGYRAVGFIFLLGVLFVSSFGRRGPSVWAAMLSVAIWNFFFIPPKFTLAITEPEDFMMCLAYLVTAVVAGYLGTRIRKQESDLVQREFRSNVLYQFGKQMSEAKTIKEIGDQAAEAIGSLFNCKVAVLLEKQDSALERNSLNSFTGNFSDNIFAVADWSFKNSKKAGWSTNTLSSSRALSIPLTGRSKNIGVVLIFPKQETPLTVEQENLLDTIVNHLAVALERYQFEQSASESQVLKQSEKLHQTLLNSVSHELRTPITAIIGASSALQDAATQKQPGMQDLLLKQLVKSSTRLNQVVENLLDMSRISSGSLQVKKEIFGLKDFVLDVLNRNSYLKESNQIKIIADDEVFVAGDDRLLEHVLLNLINNSILYGKKESEIQIKIQKINNKAVLSVKDQGPGIPEELLQHIFKPFYRLPHSPVGGTGLGLAICQSIVEAHGGHIEASNSGGAEFAISFESVNINETQEQERR